MGDCGVAAVYLKKPAESYKEHGGAAYFMYHMLLELQHRGHESAGIAVFNPVRERSKLKVYKDFGLVHEVFRATTDERAFRGIMEEYNGTVAIGQIRYPTSGVNNSDGSHSREEAREEMQPFIHHSLYLRNHFALGWNGNNANYDSLKKDTERAGEFELNSCVDTEMLMHLIAKSIREELGAEEYDVSRVLERATANFDGSYSAVVLNRKGVLLGFRDPHEIMPLSWGENENFFAIASETKALDKLGIHNYNFVRGGEYVQFDSKQVSQGRFAAATPTPCFFQWMYFAHPNSTLDGLSVRLFREKIGGELARIEPQRENLDESWAVLPIPETSLIIGRKMAQVLGIPCYEDALIKSAAVRSFIEKKERRDSVIAAKYNIDPWKLNDKNLIVVDDSIVRGTTFQKLMSYIRSEAQPRSIHFRSASPPIKFFCCYGINFPTLEELIAHRHPSHQLEEALASDAGIASVAYLPYSNLMHIFRELGKSTVCDACLTGNYPTPAGQRRLEEILTGSKR